MEGILVFAAVIAVILITGAAVTAGRTWQGHGQRQERIAEKTKDGEADPAEDQKIPEMQVQKLRDCLLGTEKKLWEIREAEPYEVFFDRCMLPLQNLLGLAAPAAGKLPEETRTYYLRDVIAGRLGSVLKNSGGSVRGQVLLLPGQKESFPEEKTREQIRNLSVMELEKYIRENELRIAAGEIALRKKRIVTQLGGVLEQLSGPDAGADKERAADAAGRVRAVLEQNGIYPMFAGDDRLAGYPGLRRRFMPPDSYGLRYPGLFIEQNGVPEVLGAGIGMDDCGG